MSRKYQTLRAWAAKGTGHVPPSHAVLQVKRLLAERDTMATSIKEHNDKMSATCVRKRKMGHCLWKLDDPYICCMCDRNYLIDATTGGNTK